MTGRRKIYGVYLAYSVVSLLTVMICHAQEFSLSSSEDRTKLRASIYTLSPFQFGAFYPGNTGGTVMLTYDGMRSSSGSIVLLPLGIVGPAVFEIRSASNTMVQLLYDKQVHLKSAAGASILLLPGELSLGNPFITPPGAGSGFTISMGGVIDLNGGTQYPPGEYAGVFQVNLVVE